MESLYIILFGLIAASVEIVGGALVVMRSDIPRRTQDYLIALSAGFLLALVFVELIPESLAQLGSIASLYIIIGYAVFHFFEHTVVGHLHFGEETHNEVMVSKVTSISTFSGLFIHALFDGITISAGMQFNFFLGLLVFFGILLHKLPEGLTVASVMLAAEQKRKTAFMATASIGLATMLGILIVFVFSNIDQKITGIAFAFSAGAAAYVGASDLIPEINRSKNRITPIFVFLGMILFYAGEKLLEMVIAR
jgi:ZIP family zinc transporter/zinc and cadmium transporter